MKIFRQDFGINKKKKKYKNYKKMFRTQKQNSKIQVLNYKNKEYILKIT